MGGPAGQLYWLGMTHRVGAKGQVVIPKRLRERQGLGPGVSVAFEERPDGVLVRAEAASDALRGRYSDSGMAANLLEDRAAERR
jgi:antitoxin PrlF